MRFIGNKTKLLSYIHEILKSHDVLVGERFFDFFSGTASVGRYFKEHGFDVTSSDILYFSYVLQEAYIGNTGEPDFKPLLKTLPPQNTGKLFDNNYETVLHYLDNLQGTNGFIYQNYTEEGTKDREIPRKFFKGSNGQKIDAIRQIIEAWHQAKLIDDHAYFVLLATLIESVPFYANISGVYAAFLKSYDPRAVKDLVLRPIELSPTGKTGKAYCRNSMEFLDSIDTDILYLDPPYNGRQYAPNYHLLETIARYDNPPIKGVAGIRPYEHQKSVFCNAITAIKALDEIAATARYKVLVLSYNSEGIMKQPDIMATLGKYGKVNLYEVDYRRFKSNSNGQSKHKTHVQEQVYVLRRS